jgi:hypothetical protein
MLSGEASPLGGFVAQLVELRVGALQARVAGGLILAVVGVVIGVDRVGEEPFGVLVADLQAGVDVVVLVVLVRVGHGGLRDGGGLAPGGGEPTAPREP